MLDVEKVAALSFYSLYFLIDEGLFFGMKAAEVTSIDAVLLVFFDWSWLSLSFFEFSSIVSVITSV